ncbi:MAG TPA: hypothetical protein DCZ72_15660 [Armatimonadetes bacterium]|nr:hypothetical protein [Armatimonadota bacterium]
MVQPLHRATMPADVAVLLICLALLLGVLSGQVAPPTPPTETTHTVTIAAGDTLWDLATDRAAGRDRRDWVHRACELNGWSATPLLQVGQTITVPDWRAQN